MSAEKLVRGETRAIITADITNVELGQPETLTGATVVLHVRNATETVTLFDVAGNLLPGFTDSEGNLNLTYPAYTTPGSGGRVEFPFLPGQLDIPAGSYEGEIEITYPDGSRKKVFDLIKMLVRE